jgi:hypothetical protein
MNHYVVVAFVILSILNIKFVVRNDNMSWIVTADDIKVGGGFNVVSWTWVISYPYKGRHDTMGVGPSFPMQSPDLDRDSFMGIGPSFPYNFRDQPDDSSCNHKTIIIGEIADEETAQLIINSKKCFICKLLDGVAHGTAAGAGYRFFMSYDKILDFITNPHNRSWGKLYELSEGVGVTVNDELEPDFSNNTRVLDLA